MQHETLPAMHRFVRSHDSSAKCRCDRLMSQADAEYRYLSMKLPHDVQRSAGFLRRAWSRRQDDGLRRSGGDFVQIDDIVPHHAYAVAQPVKVPGQVVGEGIEVVDEEEQSSRHTPCAVAAGAISIEIEGLTS